jgi:3-methylcrotonyl-CoA carboxylase alpha subunit
MIKASAGGGGKGMRIARDDAQTREGYRSARNEAKSAFGDDRVFIEKFIEEPRHIEIQVLGDKHGNVIFLGERECSIQRRHQKVIEEAPSPFLDAKTRAAMGAQAVALSKAVDYASAGTVEFIVDGKRNFYFLEMNTRLQVEHPVTECITGLDLVEWMIRIAAGEKLTIAQKDVKLQGWAVEARVYAEDPARNFLPSTGTLVHLRLPPEGPHVRVDTGVREGDTVTPFYDPMIAKVIVHDRDRTSALRRMAALMGETEVVGVTTNAALLKALCAHPAFVSGEVDTGFIERHRDALFPKAQPADDRTFAIATLARLVEWQEVAPVSAGDPYSPWSAQNGFRLLGEGHDEVRWKDGEREVAVKAWRRRDGGIGLELPGSTIEARVRRADGGRLAVSLAGETFTAAVVRRAANDGGIDYTLFADGGSRRLRLVDPLDVTQYEAAGAGEGSMRSPLPGKIIDLRVKAGDTVSKGQPLLVLEAMKMEHTLAAPADGTVKSVRYAVGEQVPEGAELVEFE